MSSGSRHGGVDGQCTERCGTLRIASKRWACGCRVLLEVLTDVMHLNFSYPEVSLRTQVDNSKAANAMSRIRKRLAQSHNDLAYTIDFSSVHFRLVRGSACATPQEIATTLRMRYRVAKAIARGIG